MKNILVIGAGRSATSLIEYLLTHAEKEQWKVIVGDMDKTLAEKKVGNHPHAKALQLNGLDHEERAPYIQQADVVISMLPASLHGSVVRHCIEEKTPVITPSYLSDEVKGMNEEALKQGVLVLNEMGVDPGIDHMSAMQIIHHLKAQGATMGGFESFTGGLVAPESDNNPWNYKFTWNPRNVVLAGQGGAVQFKQEGTYKYIPYHHLFRRTEVIDVEGWGKFEGYANRDSLKYREVYDLKDIDTIFRGTLRRPGYCRAWDVFVQLGCTDDSYQMKGVENMTYREFFNSFLAYNPTDSVEIKLKHYLNIRQDDADLIEKLEYIGLFDHTPIGLKEGTPAQILEHILKQKLSLSPNDKDMIVMWHKFEYELNGERKELHSSMVVKGSDQENTAMSKTVGYPLAIAAKMILNGKIKMSGVQLPIHAEIYTPILEELKETGIVFTEKQVK